MNERQKLYTQLRENLISISHILSDASKFIYEVEYLNEYLNEYLFNLEEELEILIRNICNMRKITYGDSFVKNKMKPKKIKGDK